jgi:stage V sporulation protein AD
VGKIVDLGVNDMNNMGAAMAPAAADTIAAFLEDTGASPDDFDLIVTGDLGFVGSELMLKLLRKQGLELSNHNDCGMMIFDRERQDVHSGGSGCGCSASVLCSYILQKLSCGDMKNVLFCATGALMSPTSSMQGQTIPAIAHLIHIAKQ